MTRVYAALAIGVIAVSFAAIFIRIAQAPPLVIATYRLCSASLILLPLAWARSREELSSLSRKEILAALFSGVFLALHFSVWITSLNYTSVATSVVLVTVNPIFVVIASRLLFGEPLRPKAILGILVCLVGGMVVAYGNWRIGVSPLFGGLMSLSGALAMAGYLLIGRRLRRKMGLISYTFLVYSSAGLLLLLTTLALGYSLFGYSVTTYAMLVLLALVPQLLGHSLLNWSLRFVSATLVTIAILGEPVGATVWAWLILGEAPTITEVVGGVLILAGIFVALYHRGEPMVR